MNRALCFVLAVWPFASFRALAREVVVVPVAADSLAWEQVMEQTVVTATRTPRLLKDVPVATRVITAADIRRADVATVAGLLQQELPGLEFAWAMSREVSLNLCGFGGNSVLFLVDGERLAGETMNNPDYQRLNLDNVERIEIVRGAASSLYGSSAVGGVVNIITRKAVKPVSLNLNLHGGSHGERRLGAVVGNKVCPVANTFTAQHTAMERYEMSPFDGVHPMVANEYRTFNFSDRLAWQPSKVLDVTARAGYFFRQRGYDDTQDNRYRDFSGGLRADYRPAKGHTLELAYTFDQYDKSDYSLLTHSDIRDYSNVQHALRTVYTGRMADRWTLTAGADVMRDYLLSYMFADDGRSQITADGFVQADWQPTRQWEVLGGLRYDYYSASSSNSLTGKLAMCYKPRPDLTLRASYSGGFRAPTLKELYMNFDMAGIFMIYGNRHLHPERTHNVQLGAEYRPGGWELMAALSVNRVGNRVTTVWDSDAPGLYGSRGAMRYRNIGAVDILGLEAGAARHWNKHWDARLSYSLTHVHLRSDELFSDDTRPHSLTARMGWHTGLGADSRTTLSVNVNTRWLSPMKVREMDGSYSRMNDTKTRYPGYAIVKVGVRLTTPWGVGASIAVDNLLNYRPARYTYYSPKTTGTTLLLGLSYGL